MSWSNVFPILTPDHVRAYEINATAEERAQYAEWFGIKRWINRKDVKHIVSTSLFWRNINSTDPDTPTPTRELMMGGVQLRGKLEIPPWSHYVEPLLEGARKLQASGQNACFRIYLAADLEFLVPDLIEAGCEIALMRHSSLRHNPGAMWRYLALEDAGKYLVSFTDADRAREFQGEMDRTIETSCVGLSFWRVPTWGEINDANKVAYRPILGCQLGACQKLVVKHLMAALVWHCQHGSIKTVADLPGCAAQEIHGTVWPNYGFDEWFLLAAVYPRVVHRGVLSFLPSRANSRLLPLDIEYVMWMNPKSELVHFGAMSGGGCCGPAQGLATRRPVKSNRQVLLTGIWRVETPGDVCLINEMVGYVAALDWPVDIRPILHVRNEKLLKQLPEQIREQAVLWRNLKYSTFVQEAIIDAVVLGHDADWSWVADSDERVDWACVGGLKKALRLADQAGADYIAGEWIDRIALQSKFPKLTATTNLAEAFPRPVLATKHFENSAFEKIALRRRTCSAGSGNHVPRDSSKIPTDWTLPVWHFKWHAECAANNHGKHQANARDWWSAKFRDAAEKIESGGEAGVFRWEDHMPAQGWLTLKPEWKKGVYGLKGKLICGPQD